MSIKTRARTIVATLTIVGGASAAATLPASARLPRRAAHPAYRSSAVNLAPTPSPTSSSTSSEAKPASASRPV